LKIQRKSESHGEKRTWEGKVKNDENFKSSKTLGDSRSDNLAKRSLLQNVKATNILFGPLISISFNTLKLGPRYKLVKVHTD